MVTPSMSATISAQTSIANAAFTPSKGVTIGVSSDSNKFTATSSHESGTKEFCTCGGSGVNNCDPAKMYRKDKPASLTEPSSPDTGCNGYTAD